MSRIFISHSSANNAAALALTSWLDAQGWSDYFLDIDASRGITPGERWMAALAAAVDRCEAVIFLVSPAWRDSKFCFAEFFEAKKLGKRIFGVIVEPIPLAQLPEQMTAEWQVCDLTGTLDPVSFTVSRLPALAETVVHFPRAGLEALSRGLQNAGLDASTFVWPPEGQPDRAPYPGLRALEEADAAVFFGREAAIVRAIDQMRLLRERDVEQLFVVLGASGAGKSSFLRAGLLPRLRRDGEHFVVLPPIRPERAAMSGSQGLLSSLKAALATAGQPMSGAALRADLAAIGLAGVLGRIGGAMRRPGRPHGQPEPTLVVPVDQAEELFAADGQDEAGQFLEHLAALRQSLSPGAAPAVDGRRLRVLFVLTIRSDSLPRLQGQAALQAMSPVLFSLPAMPVSEFKAVIEGPAKRHSATVKPLVIAPQLTEQLVVDAQGADALPLLALTLEWLYREFTDARGTRIGYEEYQRLGGVRGVIGMAVERAFEQPGNAPAIPALKAEQERLLRQVFPYLATVDPDSGDWKRRVALRDVLRQRLPQGDALVSRLVEQRLLLADSRRMADGAEPVEVIEVAHEALLRQWDAMERWLREFAAALSASEAIRRSANDWQRSKGDEALLVHTAHRLQGAEALLADELLEGRFEAVDGEYLAACRERDRRGLEEREDQLRRIAEQQAARAALQRRATWGLSAAALIALGMVVWIVMQTREVSLQTSLVLASAAETAADQKQFDRSLRLGVLAAKASWLHPAHATAAPVLARAADDITLRSPLIGHQGTLMSASFSRDGTRLVTASRDTTARLWDAETGKPVGEPMRHADEVVSATFSRDGGRVVTASNDGKARIWSAATGKLLGEPMDHGTWVFSAGFSPDGKRVLTTSGLGIRFWDADTGKPVNHPGDPAVTSFSYSPDGKRLAMASGEKVLIWDVDGGLPMGDPITHDEWGHSATFSPDGNRLVTVSKDKAVRVWEVASGKLLGQPVLHAGDILSAFFSSDGRRVVTIAEGEATPLWDADGPVGEPTAERVRLVSFSLDGKRAVTASSDKTARLWAIDADRGLGDAMTHREAVLSASFSPDDKFVVTGSEDGMAQVWNADSGRRVGEAMAHRERVTSATFSPDGRRVITASQDRTACIWDAATGKLQGEPMAHDGWVYSASFSTDGKLVVTASGDTKARVWDAETGKAVGQPMQHGEEVYSARFSPDGTRVVTASKDGTARIWDAATGKALSEPMAHGNPVQFAGFSADGKQLVTLSQREVRLWDPETGKAIGPPIAHEETINAVGFSADGRRLVTASDDKTARIWDAASGKPLGEPMTHNERVASASFSPDGKRVVTASKDSTARLWDAATGKPVSAPTMHDGWVYASSFSHDGKRMVTASGDKTARVWSLFWPLQDPPSDLISEVCQRKLHGSVRLITEPDIRAARILSPARVGEDVCDGVATPRTP